MKIKLDKNTRLTTVLSPLGHDVDTVLADGLMGGPDATVWQAARLAERFFIT
jgi:hypothetical protein